MSKPEICYSTIVIWEKTWFYTLGQPSEHNNY